MGFLKRSKASLAIFIFAVSVSAAALQQHGVAANPLPAQAGSSVPKQAPLEIPSAPVSAVPSLPHVPGQLDLNVVVTDRSGKRVTGLAPSDFTLIEDKHPTPLVAFRAWNSPVSSPPVHLILVIDTVNIRFNRVAYVRHEVNTFLRENGGRLATPVSVLWVTDTGIEVNSDTTDNGDNLAQQLDATEGKLRILGRDAGAWGDIEQFELSVQMLKQIVEGAAAIPGRKLIVWLGPGWPMLDSPNIVLQGDQQEQLFQEIVGLTTVMRRAQISLYSVSQDIADVDSNFYLAFVNPVKKPSDANPPNLALKVLAVESGGMALNPSNDLKRSIQDCAQDAGPYYTLGIKASPAHQPDEFHALKVRIDKPGLTARTVPGYYSQPPHRT